MTLISEGRRPLAKDAQLGAHLHKFAGSLGEHHSIGGEGIEVRGLHPVDSDTTHPVSFELIGYDHQDIRADAADCS